MTASQVPRRPVPVVRLVVADGEGRVLILKRARTAHGEGRWCLPGGKVDYGETVAESVVKELREETTLECTASRFLFYQDSLAIEPGGMHCVNLYFECAVRGEIALNPESSAFAWIGPEELAGRELAFRNAEGLRRYWRQRGRAEGG